MFHFLCDAAENTLCVPFSVGGLAIASAAPHERERERESGWQGSGEYYVSRAGAQNGYGELQLPAEHRKARIVHRALNRNGAEHQTGTAGRIKRKRETPECECGFIESYDRAKLTRMLAEIGRPWQSSPEIAELMTTKAALIRTKRRKEEKRRLRCTSARTGGEYLRALCTPQTKMYSRRATVPKASSHFSTSPACTARN